MTGLEDSYGRFGELLTLAENYLSADNCPAAVGLAQIAARYAFPGNVGIFGSPRLERLVLKIGEKISTNSVCPARSHDGISRKILHVLSYGRPVGGNTRFARRWIKEESRKSALGRHYDSG